MAGIRKMLRGLAGGLCGRRSADEVNGFFNVAVPEAGAPNIPDPRPSAPIRGCLIGFRCG
jgi:hypothetical protein